MTRRFGIFTLQHAPLDALIERWRRAEDMGFDSLWIADHTTTQYPSLMHFEAWTLLAAMARETKRVRIGPLVTPITFRHPAFLAMEIATVDHLSGGRVEIGFGSGGAPLDAAYVGADDWPAAERLRRFREQVDIIDRVLRGETVTSDGYYPTKDAQVFATVQKPRPPLVIAAQAPAAMRVVARYADTWNTLGGQPMGMGPPLPLAEAVAATRRQAEELAAACAKVGRDPSTIRRSVLLYKSDLLRRDVEHFEAVCTAYLDEGFDDIVMYWPYLRPGFDDEASAAASERLMERAAADVVPRLRRAGAAAS